PVRAAHCRENPYRLLTHWVRETEPAQETRHEVRRQLDLVATLGCAPRSDRMQIEVSGDARGRVAGLLADLGVLGGDWAVVHAGASAASRRYPPERFAEVCRQLV